MRLAFSGKGRYTDFSDAYSLYLKRSKTGNVMDEKMYRRVIKDYCHALADRLLRDGMADVPGLGTITAATITRKAQYRGDKYIGYGGIDRTTGRFDGKLKTFGIVFLPQRGRKQNLRCYGFVANRRLFRKMKEKHENGSGWALIDFKDEMI